MNDLSFNSLIFNSFLKSINWDILSDFLLVYLWDILCLVFNCIVISHSSFSWDNLDYFLFFIFHICSLIWDILNSRFTFHYLLVSLNLGCAYILWSCGDTYLWDSKILDRCLNWEWLIYYSYWLQATNLLPTWAYWCSYSLESSCLEPSLLESRSSDWGT
jgi:hypothetical protein